MIRAVVEQHAEEAAFLFTLRSAAAVAPHVGLEDLARIDARIEANLDGLEIAGEAGQKLVLRALPRGDAGDVFTAAVLACRSRQPERLTRVLAVA
ncbi:MAG TPA: hypothetical protein VHB21_14310, partial [Minicystis sp.]|nr:hypothetical protein [Minicystis sp.]